MRLGGAPPSCCSSGVAIQSAMASNIEIEIAAPSPVRPRAISASRIASYAFMPAAMSQTDTPTRAGASGPPVTEATPASAWISMS
jgi:hypothetical protein